MNEHSEHEDDTGVGYPEEQPSGGGIDAREHAENDATPEHDAPETSSEDDGDAGQATAIRTPPAVTDDQRAGPRDRSV